MKIASAAPISIPMSLCLGAGIRGIRKELPLLPIEGNAYQIAQVEAVPASLREACEVAAAVPELREIFGAAFIDTLVRIAAFEASACERRVSDVERRRYFKMV